MPYPSSSVTVHHGIPSIRRRPKYSVRAFWVSILIISCIAVISLLADNGAHISRRVEDGGIRRRGLKHQAGTRNLSAIQPTQDFQDCRLVHKAADKCAFVHSNCPDEEAGLISYLSLYYCSLPRAKPVAFIIIAVWLGLLFSTIGIAASDFFCINLSTISSMLGMSESMAGVTFLAFGNGSPDVFSTFAAMGTHSGSLAVGELIGAAGFITAVVAGSMALVRPFQVARKSFVRDVGFFIVAVSFSMVFLADGSLHLWECIVMVGFYVFYVAVVVVWHWWLGRRRERNARKAAARREYFMPDDQEIQAEPETDEDDADADERTSLLARTSEEDFSALERGASPRIVPADEDDEEEARDRWLAELNSNMRVSRPPRGERRNTINPIRPSLVGALEFRAVLSSLQKAQHIQTIPLTPPPNIRRYSDDPVFTLAHQQNQIPTIANIDLAPDEEVNTMENESADIRPNETFAANRRRAVSTSDAMTLHLNHAGRERGGLLEGQSRRPPAARRPSHPHSPLGAVPKGTRVSPTPPPRLRIPSPDLLAPPQGGRHLVSQSRTSPLAFEYRDSPSESPKTMSQQIPTLNLPPPVQDQGTDASGPASPFPVFNESLLSSTTTSRAPSIRLPSPSLSPVSFYHHEEFGTPETNPISWWPYKVFPPPQVLASTLFPTLYSWNDKNIWERFLGVVAAPSVFILAITLPVVEGDKDDDSIEAYISDPALLTPDGKISRSRKGTVTVLPADSPTEEEANEWGGFKPSTQTPAVVKDEASRRPTSRGSLGLGGHGNTATVATSAEDQHQEHYHQVPKAAQRPASPPQTLVSPRVTKKEWNRWLLCVQIITAPFFVVLIVWANLTPEPMNPRTLLRPVLFTLLGSLVALVILLVTTSSSEPPRWHSLFCFLGFVVSISWISTIANEVVGVLKAFGIILNISDAILGLTIFAVGNSLGDLVADVTVARLGYPVMALSACFGGPMLNILLGIGISGLYLTLRKGHHWHDKHPNRPTKYKPYQIEVSSTLMISAITLLVTLVALLIVVPLNGWKMDRRIGWGLIAIWCISTVGNLVVEIAGYGGDYT
ncbi:MAG: hypothetical protein M1819_004373 [Sarea resinae]|nr:MAG: hypothetical protein M1819_004373 [Sarea resinae]